MKHARQGAGALLALAIASAPALADEPADRKPGFFRQLGKSLKDAGQQALGAKPAASGAAAAAPLYTPVSGGGRINGLFKNENHQSAQQGRLDWPRVALTYKEWGANLPCWTVEARIWTSSTASTTETFRACADAPLTIRDDLGEEAELNSNARAKATTDLMVGLRVRAGKPNTGDDRTAGPTPPREPFNVRTTRDGVAWQARKVALSAAWVSGFLRADDLYPGPSGILTPFRDTRMWIAGFDPAGNRDK
ncbi:hypothetical protein K7565_05930 [Stenotrophomonas maltophilia]|uniref:hypothetical protein n=1 Tax=Stenotrophomonas maltophilia TaxID=40324 RepID=UPI001D10D0F5|nr:hypothetical protein [Stenotrophomonas maltophilia]MCU1173529.1 hypothetical protein [Stenotrophomonas maltophilia]UXB17187.1 hypothetical protein K7565_05930 [Stenotrophomonas maltophilia]